MLSSKRKMEMESPLVLKNSKMESDVTSLLEKLPCEMIWMIFDYVPEAVFDLRLTSRQLKSLVDIYGTQASEFPIVDYLTIHRANIRETMITINAHVASRKSNFFELRLKLKGLQIDSRMHIVRENRMSGKRYSLMLDIGAEGCLAHFNSSFGGKIGGVILNEFVEEQSHNVLSKLLHGTTIGKLSSSSRIFSLDDKNILMEMIDKHKVGHLEISTAAIDGCAVARSHVYSLDQSRSAWGYDIANVLCCFSTRVRSLKITQYEGLGIDRIDRFFLGVKDFNWVPVILKMFTNKLESLEIDNLWYPEYLSSRCIEAIGKKLPLIKEVWFKASCDKEITRNIYANNDHIVRVYHSFDKAFLAIEHFSKKNYASS